MDCFKAQDIRGKDDEFDLDHDYFQSISSMHLSAMSIFIYLLLFWSETESTLTEATYWPIVPVLDDK
jgi:hypothetical protein